MREVVIVAMGRSAVGKAPKGALRYTRPDDIGAEVIKGIFAKIPTFKPELIDDVIIGCAMPEAEQGYNIARIISTHAGIPESVPAQTVNRFCSSGLQTIAIGANAIMAQQADIILAGGAESMSAVPMGGERFAPNPSIMKTYADAYLGMGLTAENVADDYGITRQMQDEFAVESHKKAAKAQAEGKFDDGIIPVTGYKYVENKIGGGDLVPFTFAKDEGVRPDSSMESMAKLKTVFKAGGKVTAGTSSQMSDGAGFVLLMAKEKAEELGLKPIAKFVAFAAAGVPARVMGIGPIEAIPKALKLAKLTKEDIDLFELNEAFASQALACINTLGLDKEKINVNGGAIALGHPLGATGGILTVKLINELKRSGKKRGLVSMCIGGGMGAAGIFEVL